MRRITRIVIVVALFALLPAALLAQEADITLETLAEAAAALTERIDGLQERVEQLEGILTGPGAIELEDGGCQIAGDGGLQNETIARWKEKMGEWPNVDQMRVASVVLNEDGTSLITYVFSFTQDHIEEIWDGCDFVSVGELYETDWEGNRTKK